MNKIENKRSQKNFVLISHEGSHNKGCEALVRTCIDIIRREYNNATFILVSEYPEHDHYLLDIANLSIVPARILFSDLNNINERSKVNSIFYKYRKLKVSKLIRKITNRVFRLIMKTNSENYDEVIHLQKIMTNCDAVISIGGDMFIDDWGPPILVMKTIGLAQAMKIKTIIIPIKITKLQHLLCL